ncbi:MAG TPA: purine-nucleoside phosphorylase [Nocardioidaceae bacterium]|nr:purine-nucleoside phosphorylase [Nocardioidaceae bacterium]
MSQEYAAAQRAADRLAQLTGRERHDALVVLGSGWGPAAAAFGAPDVELPVTELPGFLPPAAPGHAGRLASVERDGVRVLLLSGRTHLYEGHGAAAVVHPVRVAAAAGVRLAVLTNANGAARAGLALGQPVLISDHLNLTGVSPLAGARFVDLTRAWSPRLRGLARRLDPSLVEGVYALLRGPHYQTRAETHWLRALGADMIGMSTVLEAIAAREAGLELLGLSTVTATVPEDDQTADADADAEAPIDPDEVVAVAERTAQRMGPLLAELVATAVREGRED